MIELKEIKGYLDTELKVFIDLDGDTVISKVEAMDACGDIYTDEADLKIGDTHFKLILRPLSQIKEEITHNGETFVPANKLSLLEYGEISERDIFFRPEYIIIDGLSWQVIQKLYEWHFWIGDQDRFGKDIIAMDPDGTIKE